jgi:hypothetical protein
MVGAMMNELISLPEAARRYDIPYSTLASAVNRGDIPARRAGERAVLVEPAAIEAALDTGKIRPRRPVVRMTADYRIRCPHHGKLDVSADEYRAQNPAPCGCVWEWEGERLIAKQI